MGAFVLYKKNCDLNLSKIKNLFLKKGFSTHINRNLGEYELLLYQKIFIDIKNYYEIKEGAIYACGTLFYKHYSYSESLVKILIDYITEKLDLYEIRGNFFIFLQVAGRFYIINDPTFNYFVYHDPEKKIMSSSFLAIVEGYDGNLSINKNALREVLLTGNLIGSDTLFNQVERNTGKLLIQGFKELKLKTHLKFKYDTNISKALQKNVYKLENYFNLLKAFADEFGVSAGLTGGLDSRLILIFIIKYLKNYQFYSTIQGKISSEYKTAQKICSENNLPFKSISAKPLFDYEDENFVLDLMDNNFWFNDGIVRTHHIWIETIKSKEYLKKLVDGKSICISGIGGEQYRNNERLIKHSYNMNKWIYYDLIYKHLGNPFQNIAVMHCTIEHIQKKINFLLKKGDNESHISRIDIKKYFNEIYNSANRTVRNNIENQLYFFLSPFIDYHISRSAYKIINLLGPAFQFEMNMINQLNPHIASYETTYGFPLNKDEPNLNKLYSILKNILGFNCYYKIYRVRKKSGIFYENIYHKFKFVSEMEYNISSLKLGIDLSKIKKSNFLSPLLLEASYLIDKFSSKINDNY